MSVSYLVPEQISEGTNTFETNWEEKIKITLVLAPSQILDIGKTEIKEYFPMLTVKQNYSSPSRAGLLNRNQILETPITALLRYLNALPDNADALKVVVLSSYTTWARRSIY